MAVITAVASGNWSDPTIWSAGVPVDGDAFVIPSGYSVVFDVNQSSMASGMLYGRINGSLELTTASGDYYLKMSNSNGVIGGSGSFNCGTSGSPIARTTTFKLDFQANGIADGASGLTMHWYGEGPLIRWVRTISSASIGATSIQIDTDLTTDPYWPSGSPSQANVLIMPYTLRSNLGNYTYSSIASITSASIHLNPASGLLFTAGASSWVILLHRNLFIQMSSVVSRGSFRNFNDKNVNKFIMSGVRLYRDGFTSHRVVDSSLGAQIFTGDTIIARAQYHTFSSSRFYLRGRAMLVNIDRIGTGVGDNSSNNIPIENIFEEDSACLGCLQGGGFGHPNVIRGNHYMVGTRTVAYGTGTTITDNATITNFRELVEGAHVDIGPNVTISDGNSFIRTSGRITARGTRLGYPISIQNHFREANSYTQCYGAGLDVVNNNTNYIGQYNGAIGYGAEFANNLVFFDIQDASGNIQYGRHRVWSSGGQIESVSPASAPASPPYPFDFWHRALYESSLYYVFIDIPIAVQPRVPFTVTIYGANSASSSYVQLPTFELRDPTCHPCEDHGILATASMADNTNWQTLELKHTPQNLDNLILRFYGSRSTGYTYWNYRVNYGPQRFNKLRTGGRL